MHQLTSHARKNKVCVQAFTSCVWDWRDIMSVFMRFYTLKSRISELFFSEFWFVLSQRKLYTSLWANNLSWHLFDICAFSWHLSHLISACLSPKRTVGVSRNCQCSCIFHPISPTSDVVHPFKSPSASSSLRTDLSFNCSQNQAIISPFPVQSSNLGPVHWTHH